MSEKEERILIIPCSGECNCIRPVGNELYCGAYTHKDWAKIDPEKDCKDCSRAQYNGISRSEAVERIAKALWDRNQKRIARINKEFVITPWDTVERPSPNTQVYLENAEAALNALVGK